MFRFKLQHVLDVRERLERLKQKEYSLALMEAQRLEHEIALRHQNMVRSGEHMDALRRSTPSPYPLQLHNQYRKRLGGEIQVLQQQLREQDQVLEARRRELVESRRARRTMEILREKAHTRYEERQSRRERAEMDEVAANYHTSRS
jgi:flagellar export protein FliJ